MADARTIEFAPKVTHKGFNPLASEGRCFIQIPKVASTTARLGAYARLEARVGIRRPRQASGGSLAQRYGAVDERS